MEQDPASFFSETARRLAAAAKAAGLLQDDSPEPVERYHNPGIAPLDRRRDVPVDSMTDEEALRAFDQARARVDRAEPTDPNLPRYLSYVDVLTARIQSPPYTPSPTHEPQELELPPPDDENELPLAQRAPGPSFSSDPRDTPESERVV